MGVMHSITMIILLAFVAQTSAKKVTTNRTAVVQNFLNNIVDRLVDKLIERRLRVDALNRRNLDNTTLLKASQRTKLFGNSQVTPTGVEVCQGHGLNETQCKDRDLCC